MDYNRWLRRLFLAEPVCKSRDVTGADVFKLVRDQCRITIMLSTVMAATDMTVLFSCHGSS